MTVAAAASLRDKDDAWVIHPRLEELRELRREIPYVYRYQHVPALNSIIEQALIVVVNVTWDIDIHIPDDLDAEGTRQLNGGAIDILIREKDIPVSRPVGHRFAFDARTIYLYDSCGCATCQGKNEGEVGSPDLAPG